MPLDDFIVNDDSDYEGKKLSGGESDNDSTQSRKGLKKGQKQRKAKNEKEVYTGEDLETTVSNKKPARRER